MEEAGVAEAVAAVAEEAAAAAEVAGAEDAAGAEEGSFIPVSAPSSEALSPSDGTVRIR